ncbi:MAG TPA: hypothetical protein V6D22_10245 [Candidatus Obscuribacterales bacterium]
MIKLVGIGVALLMGFSTLPAQALNPDVEFLKQLGGTVVWQSDTGAVIQFKDGTKVTVDQLRMATSDAEGTTYISNRATNSIAVWLNGDLVEYGRMADDSATTLTAALECM